MLDGWTDKWGGLITTTRPACVFVLTPSRAADDQGHGVRIRHGVRVLRMLAVVLMVAPSPKFQKRFVSVPVDVSVNVTVNGHAPKVGVASKLATGATGLLLLMTPSIQVMCEETRVLQPGRIVRASIGDERPVGALELEQSAAVQQCRVKHRAIHGVAERAVDGVVDARELPDAAVLDEHSAARIANGEIAFVRVGTPSKVAFRKSPCVAPPTTMAATSFSPQRSTPSLAPQSQPLVSPLTMTGAPRCVPAEHDKVFARFIGAGVERRVAWKGLRHLPHPQIAAGIVEERRGVIGEPVQDEDISYRASHMVSGEEKVWATGVPRKPSQEPSNCQPLLARLPPGAVVLYVGSAVDLKRMPDDGRASKTPATSTAPST